jgi:glycosyltransferase involved in cell wall biosynthesis
MKICIINNRFGAFSKGGAETVIASSVNNYRKNQDEVFVICAKPYSSDRNAQEDHIYYISTLYYFFEKLPKLLRIIWHILDLINIVSFVKILRIIKGIKPDLVLTHNLKGIGFLTVLIPHLLKIKHQHVLHDIQLLHPSGLLMYGREDVLDSFLAKIYQFINSLIFSIVPDVVSPSTWLLKYHRKYGLFKEARVVKTLNPLTFPMVEYDKSGKIHDFSFLYVGQIEDHKGLDCLLKAFVSVKNLPDFSSLNLRIIGNGTCLNEYAKRYKDEKSIIFSGAKDHEAVRHAMLDSNCLVIPSVCYENSPTVFYEAISCALPVLASDLGGNTEMKNDFDGQLFRPDNPVDLADKMIWALNNPDSLAQIAKNAQLKLKKTPVQKGVLE